MSSTSRALARAIFPHMASADLVDVIAQHFQERHGIAVTPGETRLRVEPITSTSGRPGARVFLHLDLMSAEPGGGT